MIEHLRGPKNTLEYRAWSRWLKAADALARRFDKELEDDPFAYNETTSVATLSAAAGRAGYLPLTEYVATKRDGSDRRKRKRGRCDFWMAGEGRTWAFEFKQRHAFETGVRGLIKGLRDAERCAICVHPDEGRRVAGLIVSLYFLEKDKSGAVADKLDRLVEQVDYAWRLGPRGRQPAGTYLFFNVLD
jgi:hypothetical protein